MSVEALEAQLEAHRRLRWLPHYSKTRLRIRTKAGTLIPFVFNPPQMAVYTKWREQYETSGYVRSICLKCRQPGLSTLCCAYGFSYAAQRQNINVVTFAHEADTAEEIFRTVSIFYEELPTALRPATRGDAKDGLEFQAKRGVDTSHLHPLDNLRSSYTVKTAGLRARGAVKGIGRAIQFLHLSEGTRYPNVEAIVTGPMNAVPTGLEAKDTVVLNESTARPEGAWFKGEWEQAKQGKTDFMPVFVPWFLLPEYRIPGATISAYTPYEETMRKFFHVSDEQIAWRRYKIEQLRATEYVTGVDAEDLFAQEYPMDDMECWRAGGRSVFTKRQLSWAEAHVCPPIFSGSIINNKLVQDVGVEQDGRPALSLWEYPNPNDEYLIAGDVGEGIPQGDYSVASIWNTRTCEQAGEWRGRIDPASFGTILAQLGFLFNTALIAPEINSIGYTTQATLTTIYPNLYRQKRHERMGKEPAPERVGWYTTSRTKPYLVGMGQKYLGQQISTIHSATLASELQNYVCLDSGAWGAAAGYNDDAVIAYLISMVLMEDEYLLSGVSGVTGSQQRQDTRDQLSAWDHDLTQDLFDEQVQAYTLTWR